MWTWGLNKGDENIVREGQNVVLVRNTSHRPEPGGMATAYQPAKVVHVVRHSQRDDPVAILAAEPDAPTFRFHQIKGAAASVNSTVDWNKTLDPRTAAAVYRLWTAAIPS